MALETENFWSKFTGSGRNHIVETVINPEMDSKGRVKIEIFLDLIGPPSYGDEPLIPERLIYFEDVLEMDIPDIPDRSNSISRWSGDLLFSYVSGIQIGSSISENNQIMEIDNQNIIHESGGMTCDTIGRIKSKIDDFHEIANESNKDENIRQPKRMTPIKFGGKSFYVMIMSSEQAESLRNSFNSQQLRIIKEDVENLRQRAESRKDMNSIFHGAFGVYSNLILHQYEKDDIPLTGKMARALCLGRQALTLALFLDFNTGITYIIGVKRAKFADCDYGVIAIDTQIN